MNNKGFAVGTSWLGLLNADRSEVLAGDFTVFGAATWLAFIAFLVDEVANIVVLAFELANVASTITSVAQTTALIGRFAEDTVLLIAAYWWNGNWTIVANTSVFWAAVELFGLVGDGV